MGQSHQVLRFGEKGLNQDAEKANQDGQLDHQRPQAAHRTHSRLPVEAHCFLGNAGPVAAVTLLDFPHPGLQVAHPPHLANLFQGQRQGYQPHKDGKGDNRQAHVAETDDVQHQQGVEHRANDYFIPD